MNVNHQANIQGQLGQLMPCSECGNKLRVISLRHPPQPPAPTPPHLKKKKTCLLKLILMVQRFPQQARRLWKISISQVAFINLYPKLGCNLEGGLSTRCAAPRRAEDSAARVLAPRVNSGSDACKMIETCKTKRPQQTFCLIKEDRGRNFNAAPVQRINLGLVEYGLAASSHCDPFC